MAEKIIRGLGCPTCGGALTIAEGQTVLKCTFCNACLRMAGEKGVGKFYVKNEISSDDARATVDRWFRKGFKKAKDLPEKARIEETFLAYIPFWRARGSVVGWVFGIEKRREKQGERWVEKKVPKEIEIFKTYDVNFPACDISGFGVQWVDLSGDTVLPFKADEVSENAMAFEVVASQSDAEKTAQTEFLSRAESSYHLDEVTFKHMDIVRFNQSLVYYPLWVTRYSYDNRTYQAVVDGESRELAYGKAPGNDLYRAIVFTLAMLLAAFIFTSLAPLGFRDESGENAWVLAVGAGVIAAGIGYWGFRSFRYGAEVVEGTGAKAMGAGKGFFGGLASARQKARKFGVGV